MIAAQECGVFRWSRNSAGTVYLLLMNNVVIVV